MNAYTVDQSPLSKVALNADFEKAFPPVGLQPQDRDVTRFRRLKVVTKHALKQNIQVLRFTRVLLGLISIPFLLAATVKCRLNKVDIPVAKKILDNMCMKNMVAYVSLAEKADEFYKATVPFPVLINESPLVEIKLFLKDFL